jgi:cell division septum initiation protein DivIVA
MAGPVEAVPIDFAPLTDLKGRLKDLRSQAREVDREVAKAAKSGQGISDDLLKKSASVNASVRTQERRIEELGRHNSALAANTRRGRERQGLGEYLGNAASTGNRLRHIMKAFGDISEAEKEETKTGAASKLISGASDFLPPGFQEAGKGIARILRAADDVGKAQEIAKNHASTANKYANDAGLGKVDLARTRDQITRQTRQQEGGLLNPLDAFNRSQGNTLAMSPEVEKLIDSKVKEAVNVAVAAKKAGTEALERGDFVEARKQFGAANKSVRGSAPEWWNAAGMYDELQQGIDARRWWGQRNMGLKTVPGRDD